jgi:Fe-S-cluster containining protein
MIYGMLAERNGLELVGTGVSPCGRCFAACCRQNGHAYAVLLEGEERRRFALWAVDVRIERDGAVTVEKVLPYAQGRCVFLGDDDRCTIYEARPAACRRFECAPELDRHGPGRHGRFLELNPRVLALLREGRT